MVKISILLATLTGCSEESAGLPDPLFGDTAMPPTEPEPEPPPGPEIENDFLALPPASTPEYVFVANANRNTVTRIRAADQHVLTAEVGRGPEIVRTTPDGLTAVTFNRGDDTVSVIEVATMQAVLEVCESADRTVVVYRGVPAVEVIDHDRFEIDTYVLDEPMTTILEGDGFVVLYADDGRKDAYRLDLITGELTEYRLENPPIAMAIAPTGEFAVAFTRPESNATTFDARPGMEVLDLLGDGTQPFLLESLGVGLAFAQTDGRLDALILQEEARYLYQLDLYTGEAVTYDLDLAPVDLGTLPSGDFFITHDGALGAVSFLDPATGEITAQHGFATLGLLDPIELVEAP